MNLFSGSLNQKKASEVSFFTEVCVPLPSMLTIILQKKLMINKN